MSITVNNNVNAASKLVTAQRTSVVNTAAAQVPEMIIPRQKPITEIRALGREYCETEGSDHYKVSGIIEPIDLIIAEGHGEGFCLANIIKYASRFKHTRNLNDLRKVSDYAQIACGIELTKKEI